MAGKVWHRKLAPFLHNHLGHRIYDPADDKTKNLADEEVLQFREWKQSNVERFRRAVRKIIQYDLDIIENRIDYAICCLHGDVAAATSRGTSSELTFAHRRGIAVDLVSESPPEEISGWMQACAGPAVHTQRLVTSQDLIVTGAAAM